MEIFRLALCLLGLICLAAAALEVKGHRTDLTAAGLFFWLLATVLGGKLP